MFLTLSFKYCEIYRHRFLLHSIKVIVVYPFIHLYNILFRLMQKICHDLMHDSMMFD